MVSNVILALIVLLLIFNICEYVEALPKGGGAKFNKKHAQHQDAASKQHKQQKEKKNEETASASASTSATATTATSASAPINSAPKGREDPLGWFDVELPYHRGQSLGIKIVADTQSRIGYPVVKDFADSNKDMWMNKYKVKSGDYISHFYHREVRNMDELQNQLGDMNRSGKESFVLPIKFGRYLSKLKPDDDIDVTYEFSPNEKESVLSDGMNRFFDMDMKQEIIQQDNKKVTVVKVERAHNRIVKANDRLLSINDQEVYSVPHLNQILRRMKTAPKMQIKLVFLRQQSKGGPKPDAHKELLEASEKSYQAVNSEKKDSAPIVEPKANAESLEKEKEATIDEHPAEECEADIEKKVEKNIQEVGKEAKEEGIVPASVTADDKLSKPAQNEKIELQQEKLSESGLKVKNSEEEDDNNNIDEVYDEDQKDTPNQMNQSESDSKEEFNNKPANLHSEQDEKKKESQSNVPRGNSDPLDPSYFVDKHTDKDITAEDLKEIFKQVSDSNSANMKEKNESRGGDLIKDKIDDICGEDFAKRVADHLFPRLVEEMKKEMKKLIEQNG